MTKVIQLGHYREKKEQRQIELRLTLEEIRERLELIINPNSNTYIAIVVGKVAERIGLSLVAKQYTETIVIAPVLEEIAVGDNNPVNGEEFTHCVQLKSGLVVPKTVAEDAGLDAFLYDAHETMYQFTNGSEEYFKK